MWRRIRRKIACKKSRKSRVAIARDKISPAAAVMLHLRACYVSKAAILTIPVRSVPVEKSKSRLNSKGLDR
jgi:hypothetical protein